MYLFVLLRICTCVCMCGGGCIVAVLFILLKRSGSGWRRKERTRAGVSFQMIEILADACIPRSPPTPASLFRDQQTKFCGKRIFLRFV